ncbi:class I SAM-dependent methyltransferase [Modicisalibacter radicis]|uniref:class I SAM-dependent methyltransferase n=1 Tax=Halomonas sp. EAR18 TaxID=2518972 RepID=UPI00109D5466|nr:class I SAM-dependent methyltransferase [Halomonas sp. EAR18]
MSDEGRFAAGWLSLRERADHLARSQSLTDRASDWLHRRASDDRALSLVDLGCGAASNPAYLAGRLPGPQHWRLIDHDPALLAQASSRLARLIDADGRPLEWHCERQPLTPLRPTLLDGADLVCASALFDLVSRKWAERLVQACVERRLAALFTLSVSGDWAFVDAQGQRREDAEDRWARATYQAHQYRDKGFGTALGGDAPATLAEAFEAHGYRASQAASPWRLPPGHAETRTLGSALLAGWGDALREQCPEARERVATWLAARHAALEGGELGIEVGHLDLFAEPGEGQP